MESKFSVLGKRVSRKDAFEKVTGKARYIPDIKLPGMLYAKFLRSPHAHARIKHIDTSRAESLPGVKCVLTFKDVPQVHPQRKFEFLLDRVVHHPGEEVAAVAALTPQIAEEALKLIEVDYEVLPAVFDVKEAMKPGAALAHEEYGTNIYHGTEIVKIPRLSDDGWLKLEVGNVEEGFKDADYILDGTLETPFQYNCSPMPRSSICDWEGDKLICWADTQLPLFLLRDLAASLKIPQANIRIIANHAVGGYGGKSPEKTATLVAILSRKTGRPVKAVFSRAEDFIGTHHRISYKNYNKVGVKRDGKITAMYSKITANWGSDTVVPGVCQASALLGACSMLYRCPNTKAESQGVLTNILGYGPMNGFGDPEAIYAIEILMDRTAEKINMDPVEFRLKNCMRYGDRAMEYEQVLNGPIEWGIVGPDLDSFPELIKKCAQKANWKNKWKGWGKPVAVSGYKRKGIGVAIGMHHCSFWPSSAIVKMNQDGSATVLTGAVEIGQGYASATAQVVAEVLGIGYGDVNVITADTGAAPAAIGNVASSGTSSPMNSARIAAEDAKGKILALAASRLEAPVDELETRDRRVWVKGTDKSVPIADICLTNWQITGTGNNPPYHSIRDEKSGKVIHAYAAAATIAEVEIDSETGKIELLSVVSGHDTGRSINPIVVENQVDLGLVMASGWVLSEDYRIDPRSGVVVNPDLLDYKLMTFLDMPTRNNHHRIISERPSAWGPFGAKGFSETAMTALGPAIANALYNATGIRVRYGLLTPENVLKEIGITK